MVIKSPPKAKADAFIAGAPDADAKAVPGKTPNRVKKGSKFQISLTIAPALLEKLDKVVATVGKSRAAVIADAIEREIEFQEAYAELAKSRGKTTAALMNELLLRNLHKE
jgi:predicted DNA-binding protein